MDLENAEEILQILERYTKQKSKTIPDELNSYLSHVALTGDSVYSWSKVQYFFREKLAHVIKEFHDTTPRTEDLPVSRNVDAFNYDSLKTTLLERFDLFNAAPFTIQRLSELLNEPKKHYCRLDKFMRALEKNILVVSTVEPGHRQMGSENGDSINGDPLMDINVDVEMDKEPSGSSVSPTEKKTIEVQPEPSIEESSTEIKTEQETSEQCEELPNDDAKVSTNGHHNNDEKIVEDAKANDEQTKESSDKTDNASTAIETITVEVQPTEIEEKVNSPKPNSDESKTILETSDTASSIEQPNEPTVDDVKPLDDKKSSENENGDLASKQELTINSVEKEPQNITESVKHSREDDDGDEECQPTAAKLSKIEEPTVELEPTVEPSVEPTESDNVDVDKIDEAPAKDSHAEDQSSSEIKGEDKEVLPEPVLKEDSAAIPTAQVDEQPVADQKAVVEEPIVDTQTTVNQEETTVNQEETTAEEQTIDEVAAVIPIESVQSETIIDESNNDSTSTDNTISPLASTISNDVDLEEEDEELIEPIIADTETGSLEPSALVETDVEMLPLKAIDNAEQMAVEDTAPVLSSGNSDSAMDATQIIPSTTDEQMDVLENNLMDEDL